MADTAELWSRSIPLSGTLFHALLFCHVHNFVVIYLDGTKKGEQIVALKSYHAFTFLFRILNLYSPTKWLQNR